MENFLENFLFSQCDELTLSDLYEVNLPPEGAVLVPKRPSSCHKYEGGEDVDEFYRNDTGLEFFENHRPYDSATAGRIYPCMFMPFAGPLLKVVSDYVPSEVLTNHWVRTLGSESHRPKFCGFKEDKIHFVQLPMKGVKPSNHVVDPKLLYHFFSKEFIEQVNCPQAPVYTKDRIQFPCVVKSTMSVAGRAVFKCVTEEDFDNAMDHHELYQIPYVINKMIDVKEEYCVQFCVNKLGPCTMVGATRPMFNTKGYWAGSSADLTKQQVLRDIFRKTVEPVAEKLQSLGFFGYVGCDVLVDKDGNHYVVDINPRLNHSTPLLLAGLKMFSKGWKYGVYLQDSVIFEGSEEELIERCEREKRRGEILVLACCRMDTIMMCNQLKCVLVIYSNSVNECWDIFSGLFCKKGDF